MEKVRPWRGQPSDGGRLEIRTELPRPDRQTDRQRDRPAAGASDASTEHARHVVRTSTMIGKCRTNAPRRLTPKKPKSLTQSS